MPRTNKTKSWISENQGKHFCQCGCGGTIPIQRHHHYRGIAKFLDGHSSRVNNPMTGRSGELNSNYNGGRYIDEHGYVLILIPGPGRSQYQFEHRMIMERYLGRKLTNDEIVHHKNKIKHDNRIENLQVMTNEEHSRFHALNGDCGVSLLQRGPNGQVQSRA